MVYSRAEGEVTHAVNHTLGNAAKTLDMAAVYSGCSAYLIW